MCIHHCLIFKCVYMCILDVLNQNPAHHDSPRAARRRRSGRYDTVRVSPKTSHTWFNSCLPETYKVQLTLVVPLLSREMHEGAVLLNLRKRSERNLIYASSHLHATIKTIFFYFSLNLKSFLQSSTFTFLLLFGLPFNYFPLSDSMYCLYFFRLT